MAAKKKLKVTPFELVMYILGALFVLWALTYIVLGLLCVTHTVSYDSGLMAANNSLKANGLGFLGQGLIILAVTVVVETIVLLVNAKQADREFEKEQRRAALRGVRKENTPNPEADEVKEEPEAVPAE